MNLFFFFFGSSGLVSRPCETIQTYSAAESGLRAVERPAGNARGYLLAFVPSL
jgi:hypothetical protein